MGIKSRAPRRRRIHIRKRKHKRRESVPKMDLLTVFQEDRKKQRIEGKQTVVGLDEKVLFHTFDEHIEFSKSLHFPENIWKAMRFYYNLNASPEISLIALKKAFFKYYGEFLLIKALNEYGITFHARTETFSGDDDDWEMAQRDMPGHSKDLENLRKNQFPNFFLLNTFFSRFHSKVGFGARRRSRASSSRASSSGALSNEENSMLTSEVDQIKLDIIEIKDMLGNVVNELSKMNGCNSN